VASFAGIDRVQQWDSSLHDFKDATSEQSFAFSHRSYPRNIQMSEGWSRRSGVLVAGHPIVFETSIDGSPMTLLFEESGSSRRILIRDARGERELLRIQGVPRVVQAAGYRALFDEPR
jgi:hypothetical protein